MMFLAFECKTDNQYQVVICRVIHHHFAPSDLGNFVVVLGVVYSGHGGGRVDTINCLPSNMPSFIAPPCTVRQCHKIAYILTL